jgi:hypothetical protein
VLQGSYKGVTNMQTNIPAMLPKRDLRVREVVKCCDGVMILL